MEAMWRPTRDDLLDAGIALVAAAVHVGMSAWADRFPPELDSSVLFLVLPPVLAVVAAGAALVARDLRPMQLACLYTWLMVLYTLPAELLGLAWIPSALLLTVALVRPRLSSDRSATG